MELVIGILTIFVFLFVVTLPNNSVITNPDPTTSPPTIRRDDSSQFKNSMNTWNITIDDKYFAILHEVFYGQDNWQLSIYKLKEGRSTRENIQNKLVYAEKKCFHFRINSFEEAMSTITKFMDEVKDE